MLDNDALPDCLQTEFCGLQFATPLVLLSGCVGFGEEYTRVAGFSNRDAGAICLKGKAAPVAAWRALRVVAMIGGANRAEALEPPFVGRETEFRLIRELFHATGRERRDSELELRVRSIVGSDLPFETDISRWFPLWDLPVR